MTERILFKLTKRDIIGKKVRHLRDSGIIPAVVYGNDHESIAVQANALELEKLVHKVGMTTPFNIELDDKTQLAIVNELDRDPIKGLLKHADFLTISAKELIETDIPIRLIGIGESEAERIGLVVMQVLDEAHLLNIGIDRRFQGQGYGAALLQRVADDARGAGARRTRPPVLACSTQPQNGSRQPARRPNWRATSREPCLR